MRSTYYLFGKNFACAGTSCPISETSYVGRGTVKTDVLACEQNEDFFMYGLSADGKGLTVLYSPQTQHTTHTAG